MRAMSAIRCGWRRRVDLVCGAERERGEGALELALLAPAIFLLIFGIIQGGLIFHAREVAHRAAEQGVEAGRSFDARAGDGVGAAESFLDRTGGSLQGARVSDAGSGGEQVHISVTGSVATLVPGMDWSITARAQAPVERETP